MCQFAFAGPSAQMVQVFFSIFIVQLCTQLPYSYSEQLLYKPYCTYNTYGGISYFFTQLTLQQFIKEEQPVHFTHTHTQLQIVQTLNRKKGKSGILFFSMAVYIHHIPDASSLSGSETVTQELFSVIFEEWKMLMPFPTQPLGAMLSTHPLPATA